MISCLVLLFSAIVSFVRFITSLVSDRLVDVSQSARSKGNLESVSAESVFMVRVSFQVDCNQNDKHALVKIRLSREFKMKMRWKDPSDGVDR